MTAPASDLAPADVEQMLRAIEAGADRRTAALASGIGGSALDRALEEPSFAARVEQVEAKRELRAILEARAAAKAGDRRAAAWLRERAAREPDPAPAPEADATADEAPAKPLTKKQRAFAECWAGDHTKAARDAGYKGGPGTLSSYGAKLFKDPRIQAIIAERRAGGELADDEAPEAAGELVVRGPDLSGMSTRERYEAIANDPTVSMTNRLRANERLEQMDRRESAVMGAEEAVARIREMVLDRLRAKRARERGGES